MNINEQSLSSSEWLAKRKIYHANDSTNPKWLTKRKDNPTGPEWLTKRKDSPTGPEWLFKRKINPTCEG